MSADGASQGRWGRRLVILVPFALAHGVLPRAVPDRVQDQPVADRHRAAALHSRCSIFRKGWRGLGSSSAACRWTTTGSSARDWLYLASYLKSLEVAAVSTLILLAIGIPLAYGIARSPRRLQPILFMLVVLPFWTSFLIRIYAWTNILQREGLLNQTLLLRSAWSIRRRYGWPPTPRSTSASSIRTCRSWCCRSTPAWKRWTTRCWKPPPTSAARAGRRSGW